MATDTLTGARSRDGASFGDAVRRATETKHSSKTTELYAMVAVIVGVLIAAQQTDSLDAQRAWTLVSAIAIGYMVSRGLAKSGSREPYTD